MNRVVVIGPPRAGKTTYARARAAREDIPVLHTDDLIADHGWSEASEYIASVWLDAEGPWICEGVAMVRGLRKWLRHHQTATAAPCDEVVVLGGRGLPLTARQEGMAKGCATIWAEIEDQLLELGVKVIIHD